MKYSFRPLIAGAVLALASQAQSAVVSFSGQFAQDDSFAVHAFTTSASGQITIESFGYAGGLNGSGQNVAAGGFDPVIALFSSSGAFIAGADDGAARVDPLTGSASDPLFSWLLEAGSYFIAVSQYFNFPNGDWSDGWGESGANFTDVFGCAAGQFCDASGLDRSNAYNVSISGDNLVVAEVPEPGTLALMAGALGAFVWGRRRERRGPFSRG